MVLLICLQTIGAGARTTSPTTGSGTTQTAAQAHVRSCSFIHLCLVSVEVLAALAHVRSCSFIYLCLVSVEVLAAFLVGINGVSGSPCHARTCVHCTACPWMVSRVVLLRLAAWCWCWCRCVACWIGAMRSTVQCRPGPLAKHCSASSSLPYIPTVHLTRWHAGLAWHFMKTHPKIGDDGRRVNATRTIVKAEQ